MPRGRNRRSRSEDAHDRGAGQAARHSAGLTHLTAAGEYLHAPVRAGMEDVRARAKPRHSARDLCRRPRDPVQKGQSRSGLAKPARDHGQAEAHGERGEDADLQSAGRRVRLSGIHVRANVFGEDRPGSYRLPAVKEKHSARGRESPRADRPIGNMARDHNAGGQSEPHAARMGELLRGRNRQQGVSGARCLRGGAVAPVVALQAQVRRRRGGSYPLSHLYGHLGAHRRSSCYSKAVYRAPHGRGERPPPSTAIATSRRFADQADRGLGRLKWADTAHWPNGGTGRDSGRTELPKKAWCPPKAVF